MASSDAAPVVQIARRSDRGVNANKWRHLRPTTAQIYVENRCNLKCEHCYETEHSHPGYRYALSVADYSKIFAELADLGVMYLTITGGEIFLRKDIFDILSIAKKHRFSTCLFTSGTLIDERKADRIANLSVESVEISLYSHQPEVHDSFTQIPGSHERSLNALRLLNERGVRTKIKSNLMTFNVDFIDELIEMARSVGADYSFDPTVKPRMDGDRRPLQYAVKPEQIRRLVLNRPDLYTAFLKFRPEDLCTGQQSLLEADSVLCGAARSALSISADGGVYACGFFAEPGGSLKTQSLTAIWLQSMQFDRVRETTFDKMTSCSSCELKSTCGPCMAYAEIEHNDHRECATSSRQLAEAVSLQVKRKTRMNEKLSVAKKLPIVGDLSVPRPPVKGSISTE